ncbi:nucleic-acid-binding protein from transposon X-element [Trichonephila clavipes]|nr:nucleic-acid-binding protein from transposon X-element [Trichonephila clavipes]
MLAPPGGRAPQFEKHCSNPNNSSLRVLSWNANSVKYKLGELRNFLCDEDPDIIGIQETHLGPADSFKLPNYICHRSDRLSHRGGGTAIFRQIKTQISEHRNNSWHNLLTNLHPEDNSLYNLQRKLVKKPTIIPPLAGRNGILYSDDEKAEEFKNNLEATFQENAEPYNDQIIELVESETSDFLANSMSVCLFADDAAVLAQGANLKYTQCTLQRYLHTLESWLTDWRIAINVDKTQAIVFRKHGRKLIPKTLSLFDEDIEWVNVLLLPSALVRVVCRSDRFSQFRVWLRPRRVLVGFASSCCPAPPQFWASFSCWPPSLLAIHSEQKRPLAVARDRSYFRTPKNTPPPSPTRRNTQLKRKDDDDFEFPPTRKTARKAILQDSQEIGIENQFSLLPNVIIKQVSGQLASSAANNSEPTTTANQKNGSNALPPPLMLKTDENYRVQVDTIKKIYPHLRLKTTGEYIKLYSNTTEQNRIVRQTLIELGYRFYVISPKNERPIKVVIKGFPKKANPEEIKKDLEKEGFEPERVTQLVGRRTKQLLPIFQVTLPRTIENLKIFDLKTLAHLNITVDGYNGRGVTQCFSCNNFHHNADNCYLKPRCLKCGEEHLTKDCPIKQRLETKFCINCQVYGHMANWYGCPAFLSP